MQQAENRNTIISSTKVKPFSASSAFLAIDQRQLKLGLREVMEGLFGFWHQRCGHPNHFLSLWCCQGRIAKASLRGFLGLFSASTRPQSLPSLRIWLQSTSLLAVVAGYSLLLLIGSAFRQVDRQRDHQQVDALSEQLRRVPPQPIEQALGVEVSLLEPDSRSHPADQWQSW